MAELLDQLQVIQAVRQGHGFLQTNIFGRERCRAVSAADPTAPPARLPGSRCSPVGPGRSPLQGTGVLNLPGGSGQHRRTGPCTLSQGGSRAVCSSPASASPCHRARWGRCLTGTLTLRARPPPVPTLLPGGPSPPTERCPSGGRWLPATGTLTLEPDDPGAVEVDEGRQGAAVGAVLQQVPHGRDAGRLPEQAVLLPVASLQRPGRRVRAGGSRGQRPGGPQPRRRRRGGT